MRVHRILGGFYIGGITLAATMGSYIATVHSSVPLRMFTYVTAITWLLCAWTALASVLKGNYQQHRQWMTRSFAVALVFLEVRLISGVGGWDDNAAVGETIVWICLAASLLAADVVLQIQESALSRPRTARARLAVHIS